MRVGLAVGSTVKGCFDQQGTGGRGVPRLSLTARQERAVAPEHLEQHSPSCPSLALHYPPHPGSLDLYGAVAIEMAALLPSALVACHSGLCTLTHSASVSHCSSDLHSKSESQKGFALVCD